MIVTAIAPAPEMLQGQTQLPSSDLVYFANQALQAYRATKLITSLAPGWEQALAKAALELEIPYQVVSPHPGWEDGMRLKSRRTYRDLLAQASSVQYMHSAPGLETLLDLYSWQLGQANAALILWNYDFEGMTFRVIQEALNCGLQVTNLWDEWQSLYRLRRRRGRARRVRTGNVKVFDSRRS